MSRGIKHCHERKENRPTKLRERGVVLPGLEVSVVLGFFSVNECPVYQ